MGTRAMITKDGKPFIATHWDGNPENLGADLKKTKTDAGIIRVAKKYTIDFADQKNPLIKKIIEKRFKKIAEKTEGKYTAEKLKELEKEGKQIFFGVHTAGDSPVGDINNYNDYARYQYDFKDGKWFVRELDGSWEVSKSSTLAFKKLENVI